MRDETLPMRPSLALVAAEHDWSILSLEAVLRPSGFAVLHAHTGDQVLSHAVGSQPDIVFLEDRLADTEGVQVCRALLTHPRVSASTPIVIVHTGDLSREERIGALRAGAWDVLRLPIDAEEMLPRIENFVRGKIATDRAISESLLDAGTNLYSLRGLLYRAQEIGSQAFRYRRPVACIVLTIGTPDQATSASDNEWAMRTAASLAEAMRATNRTSDAAGRMSETEFAVVAPDTDAAGAERLAERLLAALESAAAEASTTLDLRAGCYAVSDFHDAAIEPVEMLFRASAAARAAASAVTPTRIRFHARGGPTEN